MKKLNYINKLLVFITLFGCSNGFAQNKDELFQTVHQAFYGKWHQTITFDQETKFYRNDSLQSTQTWREAGKFPDLFRIQFGPAALGNTVIFRGDSAYRFRQGKLLNAKIDPNFLIYLLGGIYYDQLAVAKARLTKAGFDVTQQDRATWKNKEIIVIGAKSGDTTSNQLWYDAKKRYLVRMIQTNKGTKLDVQFEGHQLVGKVWNETVVKVFANHQLIQTEVYSNFKSNVPVSDAVFDPRNPIAIPADER